MAPQIRCLIIESLAHGAADREGEAPRRNSRRSPCRPEVTGVPGSSGRSAASSIILRKIKHREQPQRRKGPTFSSTPPSPCRRIDDAVTSQQREAFVTCSFVYPQRRPSRSYTFHSLSPPLSGFSQERSPFWWRLIELSLLYTSDPCRNGP